jgi:hypothetical protein
MSNSLQNFLVEATQTAAKNLEAALFQLPEDKRNWSSMGNARTAMDMVAECAILGDPTQIVRTRAFQTDFDFAAFESHKAELANNWEAARALLYKSVDNAVSTIKSVPDEDLEIEVEMPWGNYTIGQIIAYPYWNMSYHEAQINYIASMLGCMQ